MRRSDAGSFDGRRTLPREDRLWAEPPDVAQEAPDAYMSHDSNVTVVCQGAPDASGVCSGTCFE
jgi:hypothetical protein